MEKVERVAKSLVQFFRSTGRYEDAGIEAAAAITPASSSARVDQRVEEFAGLEVRAVGVARGDKPKCYVYVTRTSKKLERKLPSKIEDIPIVLRKVGRMQVRPEAAAGNNTAGDAERDSKNRITCGSSIAPAGANFSGTLGALVRDKKGRLLALSNNHVIGGCNHIPKGQPITSPSGPDARPGGPRLVQFAVLDDLVELRSGAVDYVNTQRIDAALASIDDPKLVTSFQGLHFDTPAKAEHPAETLLVKKVGRTTGLTTGRVEAQVVDLLPLPYKDPRFTAVVNYADVWTVVSTDGNPFALPGDSGSLVVASDESAAVGLLFATSKDGMTAFICALPDVMDGLGGGLKLLTGH